MTTFNSTIYMYIVGINGVGEKKDIATQYLCDKYGFIELPFVTDQLDKKIQELEENDGSVRIIITHDVTPVGYIYSYTNAYILWIYESNRRYTGIKYDYLVNGDDMRHLKSDIDNWVRVEKPFIYD